MDCAGFFFTFCYTGKKEIDFKTWIPVGFFLTVVAVPGFVAESPGASNLEQLLHTASVSGPSGIYSPQKTKGTVSFDTSRSVNRFHKTSRVLYHSVY